jgi:sulfite oxidase
VIKGNIIDVLKIKGIAYCGGGNNFLKIGRGVERVDISFDHGKTWYSAKLNDIEKKFMRNWSWRLFEYDLDLENLSSGEYEIICRAVDESYNMQPEDCSDIWNPRGIFSNPYHKIKIKIEKE